MLRSVIAWLVHRLASPRPGRLEQGAIDADAWHREFQQSLLNHLAGCGWRTDEIVEESWLLMQTAVHEAVRMNQPVVTSGHVLVAAVVLDLPSVGELVRGGTSRVSLREALHEILPGDLVLTGIPEFSSELTTRLTTLGPVGPDRIVEDTLADATSHAAEVLRGQGGRQRR